jgi:hypothetical protein
VYARLFPKFLGKNFADLKRREQRKRENLVEICKRYGVRTHANSTSSTMWRKASRRDDVAMLRTVTLLRRWLVDRIDAEEARSPRQRRWFDPPRTRGRNLPAFSAARLPGNENAEAELKKLMPEAIGYGIQAKRSKSSAEAVAIWATKTLNAKNRLVITDARLVEDRHHRQHRLHD